MNALNVDFPRLGLNIGIASVVESSDFVFL